MLHPAQHRAAAWPGVACRLTLNFENIGIAPMYADWKLRVEVRDAAGHLAAAREHDAATSAWLKEGSVSLTLPHFIRKGAPYTVWIGFVDPMTKQCRVALANQLPEQGGLYCVGTLTADGGFE